LGLSIAISAGEASGDLNGAELALRLRSLRPDVELWGAGGPRLKKAGVEIIADMSGGGAISISASLKTVPRVSTRYFRMRRELLRRKPDIFIPIDFGAFNIRLAQIAHKNGIPVVYYFPPSSWRRRTGKATRLLACGGRAVTPFPWSAEFLRSQGVDARFVGHPLIDVVKPSVDKAGFVAEIGLDPSLPLIGLFPGSRSHELAEHMAPMMGAARIIDRELGGAQFVVGAAPGVKDRVARDVQILAAGGPVVKVVSGRTYDCMAHSDLILTASGTATLEAAMLGTPMVIIYRGSPIMRLELRLRPGVLEEHIGMPNIVADRSVCPELINEDVTAEKLADVGLSLLRDSEALARMRRDLAEVRGKLGEPGAIERAARTVLELGGVK
jgi:lipid-A-disaccharide synthase